MYRRPIKPREPQRCFNHCAIKYAVQPEDNIHKILSKFQISIHDLRRYNRHIRNFNFLIPGDVLCIPKPKPYCSFVTPTKNAPKDSYVIVADSNGIYIMANLPPIETLEGDFDSYCVFAINPYNYNYTKLSCISKTPTIWLGQIHDIELNPMTKIYVSANKDNKNSNPNPPGDIILFESI